MYYWFLTDLHSQCIRKPLLGSDLYDKTTSNLNHADPERHNDVIKHNGKFKLCEHNASIAPQIIILINFMIDLLLSAEPSYNITQFTDWPTSLKQLVKVAPLSKKNSVMKTWSHIRISMNINL